MTFGAHPFTLRQLQYAVAVADELSFRRAAARCFVSQPSLSAQLAQLEASLGVQLFERDRRRVLATTAGAAILARARLLLRETDDLLALAQRSLDPLAGTLRLGIIPTISSYFLPRLAPALRQAYPRLTALWVEDKTDVLLQRLEAGTLDAALLALEADVGDVERAVVGEDAFVLATPIGHPLAAKKSGATAHDLEGAEVLLLDDGHCFRTQALAFCGGAGVHELAFRATSLSTLAQMVGGGAGVTLLPALAVATEAKRAGLSIRRFAKPVPKRTLALVWRPRSPLGPSLQTLSTTVAAAYGEELAQAPRAWTSTPPKRMRRGSP